MTRLEADSYSAHLRRESTRFRDVLALTPSQARVPTCPDWDADDLLWHLAEVQWFWGGVVAARPAGPPEQHPQRPA
ncbi:maleylpyruvate isomerase N-terminal domain-containing protein, partial [uncultured Nocardioides sp.]|uniref:maleylpyruvate isomerase N-terminal domain-containing protein n=1 Tax=uncultured Nocardioides sp. TaxID=198441 RepID=UPI00262BBD12